MASKKGTRKKAWDACSKYIRQKHANADGMVKCVCCGVVKHWKEMDAGHFIPKARGKSVYFLEENIHPQCPGCNRFNVEVSKIEYTRYMQRMYGDEKIDELQRVSRETCRYRPTDYLEIEQYYKDALNSLSS